jgi:hypothetical protein
MSVHYIARTVNYELYIKFYTKVGNGNCTYPKINCAESTLECQKQKGKFTMTAVPGIR